jgi:hypothetical protein
MPFIGFAPTVGLNKGEGDAHGPASLQDAGPWSNWTRDYLILVRAGRSGE